MSRDVSLCHVGHCLMGISSSLYLLFILLSPTLSWHDAIPYLRIYIFAYNERKRRNIEISCGNYLLDIYNCDPIRVGVLDPGVYVGIHVPRSIFSSCPRSVRLFD